MSSQISNKSSIHQIDNENFKYENQARSNNKSNKKFKINEKFDNIEKIIKKKQHKNMAF